MNRTSIALGAVLAALALTSCGGPSSAERKAEAARLADARQRVAALESRIAAAKSDEETVEALRSILAVQAMELDENAAAIDRFQKNEALLADDRMARIYLAVAQSKMAGEAKKIEDKLSWLRKGMASFEALREEWPDDELVFLYQASTYASFPSEVGAKAEVLDLLAEIRDRYASGAWTVSRGAVSQLAWVFVALRKNYPDEDSRAEIDAVEDGFRAAFPPYEAAAREKAAEADRG